MKYDIAIVVGGLEFNANTVKTGALGGSESAGYYMAHALAKLGNAVKLFCDCKVSQFVDGVSYIPLEAAKSYTSSVPIDVLIVQRDPSYFAMSHNSKINILWNHDLAMGRFEANYKSILWAVDKFFVLSEYHKEQYKNTMHLNEDILHITRNGIDLDSITKLREEEQKRNLKQLVYASRPERGLDILLSKVMPRLLELDPDYKLVIAGYDNPKSELGEFYHQCNLMADQLGDSVIRVGGLSKDDLYRVYLESGCYVYPSPSPINKGFAEISCITAMEAQACGLPFVGSNKGALIETLSEDASILIDGEPETNEYIDKLVNAILVTTDDKANHDVMSNAGIEHAKLLDWQEVAHEWLLEFDSIIAEKNNDPRRFVKSAEKYSDIMVAIEVAKENNLVDELAHLEKMYAFANDEELYKQQYEQFDNADIYTKEHTLGHVGTVRYEELKNFIYENKESIETVCDYGCNAGGFTTNLGNEFSSIDFIGLDINQNVLNKAISNCTEINKYGNVSYLNSSNIEAIGKNDLMICQEVLEHVAKPWELIDRLEETVKENGLVYLTVPYGPWEHDSFDGDKARFHLWHFDTHDFDDMLKGKDNLNIKCVPAGVSKRLGLPVGWWIISYNVNGTKTGVIDMERKKKLAAPLQTVSAVIMAGGSKAHEQLHWCLKPLKNNIDELIIVDCDMDDETKRIADQYNPIIVKGRDPKKFGFDVSRNIGVKKAIGDFILWIDTDEHLLGAENLTKYLRSNIFDGYSIRQHHFAVDTTFPADMPVRMFRNNRGIEFIGKIHEHPEKEMNKGPGEVIVLSDVNIAHTGYLTENIRRERFTRNLPMLNYDVEANPNRLLQKHFLMRDNMLLAQYELQETGGALTQGIANRCQEVVNIYNKYIKDSRELAHIDSLQWYTMANEILNRGVKIDVKMNINGEEVGLAGRFGSLEEAHNEMSTIFNEVGAKYELEHY